MTDREHLEELMQKCAGGPQPDTLVVGGAWLGDGPKPSAESVRLLNLAWMQLVERAGIILIEDELIHMDVTPDGKNIIRRGKNAAN